MNQIRRANGRDAHYLAELNQKFNGAARNIDDIRRFLERTESPETVLVAEGASNNVIGFACVQTLRSFCYPTPSAEITELYVMPEHRRQGVGAALVREAIRQARQDGVSEILLHTNKANEAAKRLFTQVGMLIAPDVTFTIGGSA